MKRWVQSEFRPKHPEKYLGDISKIYALSSWEILFMAFCDRTPEIIEWNSEGVKIDYFDPVRKRMRKYILDFLVNTKQADGSTKIIMIEIKPLKQTKMPVKTAAKSDRTYQGELNTYLTNTAKWKAAKVMADELGFGFVIMTEKDLYAGMDKPMKAPKKPRKPRTKAK